MEGKSSKGFTCYAILVVSVNGFIELKLAGLATWPG